MYVLVRERDRERWRERDGERERERESKMVEMHTHRSGQYGYSVKPLCLFDFLVEIPVVI